MKTKIRWFVLLTTTLFAGISAAQEQQLKSNIGVANYLDRELSRVSLRIIAPQAEAHIQNLLNTLAMQTESQEHHYVIRLLNDPVVNAYSPGPKYVYVTSGLLDLVTTDDELAFVLAHELAHGKHNHVEKSVKRAQLNTAIADTLGSLLGAVAGAKLGSGSLGYDGYDLGNRIGAAFGDTMNVAMTSGHGRKLELEADRLAVRYMSRAGFEPQAAITFSEKMIQRREQLSLEDALNDSLGLHFFSAEPGLEARVKQLQGELATHQVAP